jgi:uncharacterized membrane protein
LSEIDKQAGLRQVIGTAFIGASVIQGNNKKLFAALVPDFVGEYKEQVQSAMTGVLAAIGVGFLIPKFRLVARWVATVMLVGTLPAAIAQLTQPEQMKKLGLPMPVVIARIPAQILMVVGIWIATKKPSQD